MADHMIQSVIAHPAAHKAQDTYFSLQYMNSGEWVNPIKRDLYDTFMDARDELVRIKSMGSVTRYRIVHVVKLTQVLSEG